MSAVMGQVRVTGATRARTKNEHATKTTMKLTARGKAVFTGLGAAVLLAVSMGVWNGTVANSAPATQEVTSYVVRPGDTLWSYAASTTKPGDDVRETVQELMDLNNMESAAVSVGQRIVVPVTEQ
ncbi:MAG: LysM peptidoglycan-binding domain-containing protein [Bifidobacteriaceae bacterium]|nr:LysM peptidoglycan-binding domain-containing protein [Bifidobacteriaceae bacterium]